MSGKHSNLTDKEMEDLQNIVANTLASICTMADKHNIDRDSMLKYYTDMLVAFTEVASIQNYETNYTCNCQRNSNSRDNEPCCRCGGKNTNADKIRHMSDEELAKYIYDVSEHHADCVVCGDDCDSCKSTEDICVPKIIEWLKSESED